MRALIFALILQGTLAMQLGVLAPRSQVALRRADLLLSEVRPAWSPSLPPSSTRVLIGLWCTREQKPVISEEECIVDAESAAEADACKDPPLKQVVKMGKWEIDGYAESGAKRPGAPNPNCRRGTHGLDECLAESESAEETADCYADYGASPPKWLSETCIFQADNAAFTVLGRSVARWVGAQLHASLEVCRLLCVRCSAK
jgi:hypothetical protein